jgi:hypothetical protein
MRGEEEWGIESGATQLGCLQQFSFLLQKGIMETQVRSFFENPARIFAGDHKRND